MINSFRVKCDEVFAIEAMILQVDNQNPFVIYENDTLIFSDLNFYNIEFFNINIEKIYLQYFISSKDQKNFKNEVNKIQIDETTYEWKKIKTIRFSNCEFYNINLDKNVSLENICFKNCYIRGIVNFQNNKNNFNLSIESSTLEQHVLLQESKLKNLKLKFTTFLNYIDFSNIEIENPLDLTNIVFKENPSFLNIICNVANRETARIIKHSFEKQDNIIEANKFYALEMQKREEELDNNKSNVWDRLVFKVHSISSNHSQDWVLVLLWILNITFGYIIIDKTIIYSLDKVLFLSLNIILFTSLVYIFKKVLCINKIIYYKTIQFLILIVFLLFTDISFDNLANLLNPFSIMTTEIITIDLLLFKITIAYLIYQFIVSIRQNTRRK